jgi:hypothetical protein
VRLNRSRAAFHKEPCANAKAMICMPNNLEPHGWREKAQCFQGLMLVCSVHGTLAYKSRYANQQPALSAQADGRPAIPSVGASTLHDIDNIHMWCNAYCRCIGLFWGTTLRVQHDQTTPQQTPGMPMRKAPS